MSHPIKYAFPLDNSSNLIWQIKTLVRKLLDNYNKRRLQAGMFGAGKASSNTSNQGANNSANAQQKTSGGAKFEFENFDSLKASNLSA